jgi:CIC family chloride channel protein
MGGFLAGVTHAPLTALFLLFEMTQLNPDIALPAMLTTITALIVARAIESESIDTYMLAREGKTLAIGRERLVLTQLPVASVMAKDAVTVRANATLAEVLRVAGNTSQATLPVVDNDGVLVGLIVTHDLLALLATGDNLGPLVNAYDLSRQNPPVVTPESSLDQAAQLMEYDALDELPAVDKPSGGHFLGLVTRPSIAQAFNRVTVSLSTLDTRDQNIFWATGYRVSRLIVPPASQGRTLRELDPRARFGVSVLAIQSGNDSGAGFQPIAPDRKLQPGDLLVAAGRPGDLRRFSRELEFGG